MKNAIAALAIVLMPLSGAFGQSANGTYQAGNSLGWTNILNASGTVLADNSVVLYGAFGTLDDTALGNLLNGGLTPAELVQINDDFSTLFSWQIGDGTGNAAGTFDISLNSANASAFSDQRMYLLTYNVTSFGSEDDATEFGLLRNDFDNGTEGRFPSTGVVPVDSYVFVDSSLMTGIAGQFVDGGFEMVAVIPEPSTYALLVAGVLAAVAIRRRKKA